MRKLLLLVGVLLVAVGAGLVYRATSSEARWHILSDTAINARKVCRDGLRYTFAAGQTQDKPPDTRPVGDRAWVGPVNLHVQHAPTSTPPTEEDWFNALMAGADVFEAPYDPVKNATAVPPDYYPYSFRGLVPFRMPLTPSADTIRMDVQPNGDGSTDGFEEVVDCYLFGPLDFKPGQSPNVVDFSIVPGNPKAALLSTSTFNATGVSPGTVRLGVTGTEASPIENSLNDVNGDGRQDLVLRFERAATGLSCFDSQIMLSAIAPGSGERFYEADSLTVINCP